MDRKLLHALSKFYEKYPYACYGPADIKSITNSEEMTKKRYSDQYKEYLKKYGGGYLVDVAISGPQEIISMGTKVLSVYQKTLFYRSQNWPGIEDWYIISDDGFGNPIGIDTEGRVWLSDHDSGFEKIKLADSFDEFLYKVLTETLYE